MIDVVGKLSGLGTPTTDPSVDVEHEAEVGTTLPLPTISPACCRVNVSVAFLMGRPEGPRMTPLTVPAYAVVVAMNRAIRGLSVMVRIRRRARDSSRTRSLLHTRYGRRLWPTSAHRATWRLFCVCRPRPTRLLSR